MSEIVLHFSQHFDLCEAAVVRANFSGHTWKDGYYIVQDDIHMEGQPIINEHWFITGPFTQDQLADIWARKMLGMSRKDRYDGVFTTILDKKG